MKTQLSPPSSSPGEGHFTNDKKDTKQNEQKSKRFKGGTTFYGLQDIKDELPSMINKMTMSQNSRLDKLEEYVNIQEQNVAIQCTNQDIQKSINHLANDIKIVEEKIDSFELERKQMKLQVLSLEEKLDSVEISLLKTYAEVRNVPKLPTEKKADLFRYVTTLTETLNLGVTKYDLKDVSRSPSKKESNSSTITIEFSSTLIKHNFLDAVMRYNKSNINNRLNSNHLGLQTTKQPIYISELLTAKMKRLLFLTHKFAKTPDYKYVWPSNGHIYIKQADGKPYIRVKKCFQMRFV